MPSIQKFCDAMRWAADSDQVGYSQPDRYSLGAGDFFGAGLYNTDCSALTIAALKYGGFDTGGATYTGNMSDQLCARGWKRLPVGTALQAGDILLNDGNHVAVWLGDCLAQASIDENGNIAGGARGDQTGSEVNTRGYYNYPWDCVLRYVGGDAGGYSGGSGGSAPSGGSSASGAEWQGDMVGLKDTTGTSDDYAGVLGRVIRYVAIEGAGDYQAHDCGGQWWPKVNRYDLADEENGMAGAGNPIDLLRITDQGVSYQVHVLGGGWLPVMVGTRDTGGSSDDYAGVIGKPIDLLRVWRENGEQPRYNVYS